MSRAFTDNLSLPFALASGGVRAYVRVTPRARRTGVEGLADDGDEGARLKVWITAPPHEGAANAAVLQLLAREWRLPKSTLSIISGNNSRLKTIGIAGDADTLMATLRVWLDARGWQTGA